MRSVWRTVDRDTLRDIGLVCLADAIVGASFGTIAVSGGLPLWVPIAMSAFVFAGGAQFAAVAVVLLALVLPSLADRGTRNAALLGAVVAVAATPFLPAGLPVLLALTGLVAAGRLTRTTADAGAAHRPAQGPACGPAQGPAREAH